MKQSAELDAFQDDELRSQHLVKGSRVRGLKLG
jgi:hypothetical protein